eukprot:TRINITY_DN1342_c0_g1_i1.p1 TRINITY_DN1342_c0_g1~~TRINITY_DN1342_c0_g1_i1.p1  ORF type:complete len:137 (-),score=44.88 TRINITY_DN1342_c0_g1_i1:1045-1455(-)
MSNGYLFVMVGADDVPLYEYGVLTQRSEESSYSYHFKIHAALDAVDECMWRKTNMFLPNVDVCSNALVSAFVTAGSVRLMLLHEFRNDDGIKHFFTDVYELFIKIQLNPFHEPNSPIKSQHFDARVKGLARKYLKP